VGGRVGVGVKVEVAGGVWLGVREGAGILLFTQIGLSKEQALLMELITYAIMVVVSFLGGFYFLRRSFERRRARAPQGVQGNV
jgi:hypothetical protein